jgi:type IV pilus assembly protein PilQ
MFSQILEPLAAARAGRTLFRRCAARGLALLALALCSSLPAQAQTVRELRGVDFSALDGDRVQITLTLSGPAPQPSVFAIDSPARLSIDLPDTHMALAQRYRKVGVGQVRSIAAVEAQGRTRVVVDLEQSTAYVVSVDGSRVLIDLAGRAAAGSAHQSAAPSTAQAPAALISKIDFRRGERGEGRVLVSLSDPNAAVDVHEEGGKVVARFKNTNLPDRLSKRLDVLDFATPVKYIDSQRDGVDARIEVTPSVAGEFEQVAYQAGNQFVLELQPLSQEKVAQREREQPAFTGQRISLSFQSVDIRALLQIIGDVAGVNMIVSSSVNGQMAMRLQNVPWDQALDTILRTSGLGMRKQGNVIVVAPVEELASRERAEAEAEKQKVQLAPLVSEIIQINYAKATELGVMIKNKTNSILSERGSVTVDERTNSLLVRETRERIVDIRSLVQRLDVPVRQVLIESRIVVANDNFEKDLGTQLGVSFVGNVGGNFLTTGGTNVGGTDSTTQSFTNALNSGANSFSVTQPSGTNYNVNLPAPASAGTPGSIALSLLAKNTLVDLELSALQTEGKGEVVSTPHVITANAKPALIKQGVEIPYQASTSSGATSVSFKDAVLSLEVTPQITPDGRVIMDLKVHDDSVGSNVSTGTGGSTPAIDTREVDTQVLVDNGQTVVLGGIYQDTTSLTVSQIPLLGDIPILGYLFRNTQVINNKTELLIFITPKILTEALRVD